MMRPPRDIEHLVRLALLFLAGIVVFLTARAFLIPPGFGELGHYRTGALADNGAQALRYAGRAACADCHEGDATTLAGGAHAAVGCESCHGPLAAHAAEPESSRAGAIREIELCGLCHAANPARPQGHPQVEIDPHREGSPCTECHDSHSPEV